MEMIGKRKVLQVKIIFKKYVKDNSFKIFETIKQTLIKLFFKNYLQKLTNFFSIVFKKGPKETSIY